MHSTLTTVAFDFADSPLSVVVFGALLFSIVMGLALLGSRSSGSLYDRIGQGGLTPESDYRGARSADGADSAAEREEEIRQMLSARSERLVRGGSPPLDVEAEVARLLEPGQTQREHDHGLLEEVRQLVVARNGRRVRQGLQPLDVEAEVARTLAELDP